MTLQYSKVAGIVGLMSFCTAAMAGEQKTTPVQEPAGFVTGAVIGAFAAGPIGAVVGAGLGTWLGNRVHRAHEASTALARVAVLENDMSQLQADRGVLLMEQGDLAETNRALTARLDQLSHSVEAAQDAATILDGMQGDVLFKTGSAEIDPQLIHGIQVLAEAVSKTPALKVRVDGYADARGTVDTNLALSEARAAAVRDLFLAAGVDEHVLEINAYGKSRSVADDADGYALERRVRLTLQAEPATVQVSENE